MTTDKLMQRVKNNLAKLPAFCFDTTPLGQVVKLVSGRRGYVPIATEHSATALNRMLRITPQQVAAMKVGTARGFHNRGANAEIYNSKGEVTG